MNSVNSFADLANLVTDKATGKHIEQAITGETDHPAPNPKQEVSATGRVAEGALQPVNKQPEKVTHYVTAQGLRTLFMKDDKLTVAFVMMVGNCLKDEFDYVVDCLDKAVSGMPHAEKDNPAKGIKAATDEELTAYQNAMSRRTEFRKIFGAAKFTDAKLFVKDDKGNYVALHGKGKSVLIADAALKAAGIDWKGQSTADKEAAKAQRLQRRAAKAVGKEVADMIGKGLKFDGEKIAQLQADKLAEVKLEDIQKKLEAMHDRIAHEAKGLVAYFNGDRKIAAKYARDLLELLESNKALA